MKLVLFIVLLTPIPVMSQESTKIMKAPLSTIPFVKPSQEEVQSLNLEYQAGIELMYWLSKLEADTLTKDITLDALNDALTL